MKQRKKVSVALGWLVVILLVAVIFTLSRQGAGQGGAPTDFSTFLRHVEADEIVHVVMRGHEVTFALADGRTYTTIGQVDDETVKRLSGRGAVVSYEEQSDGFLSRWGLILIPLALILLFFIFLAKQARNPGGVMSIGKTRARRVAENDITFADVGGNAAAKEQLGLVIDFLKSPKRWIDAGVRLPHGVLLVGAPGCGKTLIARAVAGEAGVPFFSVSASEFVEIFVGVGAARVRDTFDEARKAAPAIVFIDELDAVGRRRGSGIGSSHDEREQTLNQLLVTLDGFERNGRVVVIAATNRPDVLDSALLRPGRFDLRIAVDVPDRDGRLEMLRIHTRQKPLADDVRLEEIADRTDGATGADLENLANEAALIAVQACAGNGAASITQEHFESALQKAGSGEAVFNRLDAILIESASQVSQPTGNVEARLTLRDGSVTEGRLVWLDGNFVKLRESEGTERVIAKSHIAQVVPRAGTEAVKQGELVGDRWSHSVVDTA